MTQVTPDVQEQRLDESAAPFPARRGLVVALSALAGFALTVVWSATFVDQTIGSGVANTLLGHDAKETPISGLLAGIAFAFSAGLGGTFTACNIAVFGAVAPLLGERPSLRRRLSAPAGALGRLAAGMIAVSASYGVIVGIAGTRMPQFSTAQSSAGLSPRAIQSMVLFGLVGLILCYLGLAALGVVKDPLARISQRFPNARVVFMGMLIGAFLIGRPFPMFRQLFRDAAERHNPLYGAFAFSLQSLGNIIVLAVIFLILSVAAGGRFHRWLAAKPSRIAVLTGAAFIVAGVFTFLYWDVRLLANRELIWYPTAPWS